MDEPLMLDGIDEDCAIVLNLDEKMTASDESINIDNISELVCRTMVSLIGECSNAATCYHNKPWKSYETKARYNKNIDILSIVNSFAIDFAKTGYIMNIPYEIAKYSKPYPYFMRYVGEYYSNLHDSLEKGDSQYKFQKSKKSNMNQLCFLIEKFHNREIKWKRAAPFNHSIMIDYDIPIDAEKLKMVEDIYKQFNKETRYLLSFEKKLHKYDDYKDELRAWDKESALSYHVNWDAVHSKYRSMCEEICGQKELANIVTVICYEIYPRKSKKFLWAVASAGILENIKQVNFNIPIPDANGPYEYLGRRYRTVPVSTVYE